jgi:hypothetical protein
MMQEELDPRMEKAIKSDAASLAQLPTEVPTALRSLIASTPAVQPASGSFTAAGKSVMTKLALLSAGGLLVLGAAYFIFGSDDTPIKQSSPEASPTPAITTEIDTPKPAMNHPIETIQPKEKAAPAKQPEPRAFTQHEIDSMLRAMRGSVPTIRQDDSIRGSIIRK